MIFVAVVDTGSFRGAAKELSLSPSVVSHHITQLEESLGAALFYRSTRALSLTEHGSNLLPIAKRVVAAGNDALALFSADATERLVRLRVAMPTALVDHPLCQRIGRFAKERPGVQLDLLLGDKQLSILDEGIDVAIRGGRITDSELKSRKVGVDLALLAAAPEYLERRGTPQEFAELAQHDFISFSPVRDAVVSKGEDEPIEIWGRTIARANSMEAVKRLVVDGLGMALMPQCAIQRYLDDGALVRVLPDVVRVELPLYLVWPQNISSSSTARDFIEFVAGPD